MSEEREERRRDYDVKLDVLTERVENWMETTTEYRKSLCGKLDLITERLNALPCKDHKGENASLRKDVDRLTMGAFVIISVLFISGAAWGTLNRTVEINTKKWENHDSSVSGIQKDIDELKEKSYGYRGIPLQ